MTTEVTIYQHLYGANQFQVAAVLRQYASAATDHNGATIKHTDNPEIVHYQCTRKSASSETTLHLFVHLGEPK